MHPGKLLLVITVLALSGCNSNSNSNSASSKAGRAEAHIRSLESAVLASWLDHARYPQDLGELVEDYLPRVPTDPWGRAYHYSLDPPPMAPSEARFYIWSYGRDGVPGGRRADADKGSWMVKE